MNSMDPHLATNVIGIDHIGIAVTDLNAAIAHYESAFGFFVTDREASDAQGIEEALLSVGGQTPIQLLEPTRADSPVGRFLSRRGQGLHHIAYEVVSLEASIEHLRSSHIRLVDERPRAGGSGSTIAFLHPSSTFGVLIELVQH